MKRFLTAIASALALGACGHADAAGSRLKLLVLHNRAAQTVILPGTTPYGSWAAWTQPPPVGTGTVNTIAITDRIIDETINADEELFLGVIAAHSPTLAEYNASIKNAIASVTINCDNGLDYVFTTAITSPVDGAPAYGGWLRGNDFTDGRHECRMIATPTNGTPRLLTGFYGFVFYTNAQGTFTRRTDYVCGSTGNDANTGLVIGSPKATVASAKEYLRTTYGNVGGHKIEITCAGNYTLGPTSGSATVAPAQTQWLDIEPSAGLSASDVVFTSGNVTQGLNVPEVHLKRVTMQSNSLRANTNQACWMEQVVIIGNGIPSDVTNDLGTCSGGTYVTESNWSYTNSGGPNYVMIRNTNISYTSNNVFDKVQKVLNVSVDHLNRQGWPPGPYFSNHTDIFASQFNNSSTTNILAWGVTATVEVNSQMLFCDSGGRWTDAAWMHFNLVWNSAGEVPGLGNAWNLNCPTNNLFILDMAINGTITLDAMTATNTTFADVVSAYDTTTGYTGSGLTILGGNITQP